MSKLKAMVAPGILTRDIDSLAEDLITKEGRCLLLKDIKDTRLQYVLLLMRR